MVAARSVPTFVPEPGGALVEAIADMLASAAAYSGSAASFYAMNDCAGGDFAMRKAAAFIQTAAEIRAEMAGVSLSKGGRRA